MEVNVNGELVDESRANINALDRGLLTGEGLFETMRAYNGVIFMLDRHIDRIIEGARILGFKHIPEHAVLRRLCNSTLESNKLRDARVRLTLTAGTAASQQPAVVVSAEHYAGYDPSLYKVGMAGCTLSGYRTTGNPVHALKSTSYMPSLLARRDAVKAGCHEAILTNEKGHVAEGSFTNIFAVRAGAVSTPPLSDGILPGITRECVLEIARTAGHIMLKESLPEAALISMDELFLTNSLMEIMPLTSVNGVNVGDGSPGAVTLDLWRRYRELVQTSTGNR